MHCLNCIWLQVDSGAGKISSFSFSVVLTNQFKVGIHKTMCVESQVGAMLWLKCNLAVHQVSYHSELCVLRNFRKYMPVCAVQRFFSC